MISPHSHTLFFSLQIIPRLSFLFLLFCMSNLVLNAYVSVWFKQNHAYLTAQCVVDPPDFFTDQFGHRVASVIGESLHKVLKVKKKT